MIETALITIIKELGATGVLIVGLFVILHTATKKIATPLKTINEELGEIRDILKQMIERGQPK